jgi:NADH-quinone oxidoreductase subunit M
VWGIVLGAAYLLWLFQRVMFGEVKDDKIAALSDLNLREIATLLPLAVLAVWMGLAPNAVLKTIEPPVNAIIERVRPGYFEGSDITPPPLPSIPGPEIAADTEPEPAAEPLAALTESLPEDLQAETSPEGD